MQIPTIQIASVKVMRSHDYCHFEVCLSSSDCETPEAIDELRKTAARLADKAVDQYKIAKENTELILQDEEKANFLRYQHREILKKPEEERTPEEKAIVKAISDFEFRRNRYDYQDDYEEPEFVEES